MLRDTLHKAGYTDTTLYQNGKEAWEYLQSLTKDQEDEDFLVWPDALITDIEMPQMDGHHLTLKLKDNGKLQHIPVVIFSSLITDDLYHKGQKVGAEAQISKPDIDKLVQTVDRLLLL